MNQQVMPTSHFLYRRALKLSAEEALQELKAVSWQNI